MIEENIRTTNLSPIILNQTIDQETTNIEYANFKIKEGK